MLSTLVIFKSEYELQSELHLPRRPRRQDLARSRRAQPGVRSPQVDVIQRIEHLPAKLQELLLRDGKILHQVTIQRRQTRPRQDAHAGVSKLSSRRVGKSIRIEPQVG